MVNRLKHDIRTKILHMLCEGMSMRAVSRVLGVHKTTIARLLVDTAAACRTHHDAEVQNLTPAVIECDELHSFVYCHGNHVTVARAAPNEAGDLWTWLGLCSSSKLLVSWHCGSRDLADCMLFLIDLRSRIAPDHRCSISTDGWRVYPPAVAEVFGDEVDFGQLLKLYRSERQADGSWARKVYTSRGRPVVGQPEPERVSTSHVERQNLNMRMGLRRYTRKTNGYSKLAARHRDALDVFCTFHNWVRISLAHGTTPAVAAGLASEPYPVEWLADLVEATYPPPTPRGPDKRPRRRRK